MLRSKTLADTIAYHSDSDMASRWVGLYVPADPHELLRDVLQWRHGRRFAGQVMGILRNAQHAGPAHWAAGILVLRAIDHADGVAPCLRTSTNAMLGDALADMTDQERAVIYYRACIEAGLDPAVGLAGSG